MQSGRESDRLPAYIFDEGIFMTRFIMCVLAVASAFPASAFERLDGWFISLGQCEAYQSKNKGTNPGDIRTEFMRAYDIIAINKAGGDFFQIRIEEASSRERWVHVSCGEHVVSAGTETDGDQPLNDPTDPPVTGQESTDNLLTLSWQPAFCEDRTQKAECLALNDGDLPHTVQGLSIHGLWPQPRANIYCGVSAQDESNDRARNWHLLPEVAMDADTRAALEIGMPSTQSFLDRHEWIKHGTCFNGAGGSDEYYDDTLDLLDAVNGSDVGALLVASVGTEIAAQSIRDAFDSAFGTGAGDRVEIHCDRDGSRRLLTELWLHMEGEISPQANLGDLLRAARDAGPVDGDCAQVTIDPAGLQ